VRDDQVALTPLRRGGQGGTSGRFTAVNRNINACRQTGKSDSFLKPICSGGNCQKPHIQKHLATANEVKTSDSFRVRQVLLTFSYFLLTLQAFTRYVLTHSLPPVTSEWD
jgi:hypothetical protein